MKLIQVTPHNFRNLNNIVVCLKAAMSFLVGENDVGKSNFLDMLDILFHGRQFDECDFGDISKSIAIELSITLNDTEKGIFEDLFDPLQNNRVNLRAIQENADENIRYYHIESGEEIHFSKLRCLNFIKYESLRTPMQELTFYRGRGVGRFLGYLVDTYIQGHPELSGEDFIKSKYLKAVLKYINNRLSKLKVFRDFMINASVETEVEDLIYRLLAIKDSKGFDIQRIGHGIQFSVLIILSILDNAYRHSVPTLRVK